MSKSMSDTGIVSIRELMDDFDGFIVDQYGVLHDGQQPYPDAIATLRLLMDASKQVVIVSNSGKRSSINVQRMAALGFERSLFSEFVSSGDVAVDVVKTRFSHLARCRCLLIARDGDTSAVDDLNLQLTEHADKADLVLISASEGDRYAEQHYRDLLAGAAHRHVPALCTNPDKLMLTPAGLRFGAGRIAEMYEELGGTVQWIGKPYAAIYRHATKYLPDIPAHRILCVGDSLEHDIVGGQKAQHKTLFIRGGIHQDMDTAQLDAQMQRHAVAPDYQLPVFR